MQMKEARPQNEDSPATQSDLSTVAGEMTRRFDDVERRFTSSELRFDRLDERLDGLESQIGNVLKIVESIDATLRDMKTVPARVDRLERSVFPRR